MVDANMSIKAITSAFEFKCENLDARRIFLRENPAELFGKHSYDLKSFGLSAESLAKVWNLEQSDISPKPTPKPVHRVAENMVKILEEESDAESESDSAEKSPEKSQETPQEVINNEEVDL